MGLIKRKNAKFVNEYLEKNYKDSLTKDEGLKLVAQALANNIDHPKKNADIAVVSGTEIRYLTEAELATLFDSLETE